jgi:hypothetical protein
MIHDSVYLGRKRNGSLLNISTMTKKQELSYKGVFIKREVNSQRRKENIEGWGKDYSDENTFLSLFNFLSLALNI